MVCAAADVDVVLVVQLVCLLCVWVRESVCIYQLHTHTQVVDLRHVRA